MFSSIHLNRFVAQMILTTAAIRSGEPVIHRALRPLADSWTDYGQHPLLEESVERLGKIIKSARESGMRETEVDPIQALEQIDQAVMPLEAVSEWTRNFFDVAQFESLREQIRKAMISIEPTYERPKYRRRLHSRPSMLRAQETDAESLREKEMSPTDEHFLLTALRPFIESLPEPAGVLRVTNEGVGLVMVNERNKEVSGFTEWQVTAIDFLRNVHEDDLGRFGSEMFAIIRGKPGFIPRFRLKIRDGSYIWVDLWGGMIPQTNLGVYFLIDQTEHYEAIDKAKMFQQAQRELEEIGILAEVARALAHDINNAMQIIIGLILGAQKLNETLMEALTLSSEVETEERLSQIIRDILRMGPVDREALEKARGIRGMTAAIIAENTMEYDLSWKVARDTSLLIEKLQSLEDDPQHIITFQIGKILNKSEIEASIPRGIDVDVRLNADPGLVTTDKNMLFQVINNIIQNASDAMVDVSEPRLWVETDEISLSKKDIGSVPNIINQSHAEPGNYVRMSFRDNGHGIPENQIKEMFKFGATTRRHQPSSVSHDKGRRGWGLTFVRHTMAKFGGFITVDSTVDKGTTFSLYLPAVKETK